MSDQTAVQVETKVLGGRLPRPLYDEAVIAAFRRGMNKSDLVNAAVEHWLAHVVYPCPVCGGSTSPHPDPSTEDGRYCTRCNKPIHLANGEPSGADSPDSSLTQKDAEVNHA